jgi:general secretion pathway protein G
MKKLQKGPACRPASQKCQRGEQAGFTLIELLVVISIIGILAGLLTTNLIQVRYKTRDSARKSDIKQIQIALESYRVDSGAYPASLYSTDCSLGSGPLAYNNGSSTVTYMQKVPCDPKDKTINYQYTKNSDFTYTLYGCLENTNDPDKTANVACTTSGYSYTVSNP